MISNPNYISYDTTYQEAAEKLRNSNIDILPIVDENRKPIGMVSSKAILEGLLLDLSEERIYEYFWNEDICTISEDASILDIYSFPNSSYFVVDRLQRLIGMITQKEITKALSLYIDKLNEVKLSAEILEVVLDSAYEGIAVVDEFGILREFNDAYSRFIGVDKKDVIGKHVQDVIENTNLHNTVKTGMPERGEIQYIHGQPMIVHRIPIWKGDKVIGAIGMLIFEGVSELYDIYERYHKKSREQKKKSQYHLSPQFLANKDITLSKIIGDSNETVELKRLVRKIARTDASVLITGESGTGKEMFARSIHHLSEQKNGPFISVNCAAIPEHLFESELFGYEEGAFTGAKKGGKQGKFELAQNGTLFLDEIGEMPLLMQTKLLRVLQEKEIERVGGVGKQRINTRIIAATNRDIKKMVEDGEFREDLYYRINIIELHIPPLRERVEDIPLLISHYLKEICEKYALPQKQLTAEAISVLFHYKWYGNIRELVNTIERLVILTEGNIIEVEQLPHYMKRTEKAIQQIRTPIQLVKDEETNREKQLIQEVLQETQGNKSKAAKILGIHRTTLYQKLKKYGL